MPEPANFYQVHEAFLKICDGDHTEAAILWQMIRWQRWIYKQDREWFGMSAREMSEEILELASRPTCGRRMDSLESKGFVESKDSQNPTDSTEWKVKIATLQERVERAGYDWPGPGYSNDGQPLFTANNDDVHSEQRDVHSEQQHNRSIQQDNNHNCGLAREGCIYASADDEPIDRANRESLEDHERWDMMMMLNRWRSMYGRRYDKSDPIKRKRIRFVLTYWTEEEIVEAMQFANSRADGYRDVWGAFSGALRKMAQGEWRWDNTSTDSSGDADDLMEVL